MELCKCEEPCTGVAVIAGDKNVINDDINVIKCCTFIYIICFYVYIFREILPKVSILNLEDICHDDLNLVRSCCCVCRPGLQK